MESDFFALWLIWRAELRRIADHPGDHVRALGGDINVLSSLGKCRTSKKLSKEEARKVWRARLQITPRLHPLVLATVRRYITADPRAHLPRAPTILYPRP